MTIREQVDCDYPVSPGRLLELMTSKEYLAARRGTFAVAEEPTAARHGDVIEVRTNRQVPLEQVPAAARRFVGKGRALQIDSWTVPGPAASDSTVRGTWTVDAGSVPGEMRGSQTITATPTGCRLSVVAEATVKVPLLGKQLEAQARPRLRQMISAEQASLARWVESWVAQHPEQT